MEAENSLEQVRHFAEVAHGGQRRKYRDEPYIRHPERVMETCKGVNAKLEVLAAALLHDVLEDTAVNEDAMLKFLLSEFSPLLANSILKLVVEMTDVYTKEKFPHLNRRARKARELERIMETSADAQTIKYADILDNAPDTTKSDPGFAVKMLHEYRAMLKVISKGNDELYRRAVTTVDACMKML